MAGPFSDTSAPEVAASEVAALEMVERKVKHMKVYRQLLENSKWQYLKFCQ